MDVWSGSGSTLRKVWDNTLKLVGGNPLKLGCRRPEILKKAHVLQMVRQPVLVCGWHPINMGEH